MSKSDVSKPVASDLKRKIVLTFEDVLPEKKDGTIKIKKVTKFLGADFTKFKIIGHNNSYFHNNDGTHHELTFVVENKKTKVVEKLVIDFLQKPNQKKFKGIVTLVANSPSSTVSTQKQDCEPPFENSSGCPTTQAVAQGTGATAEVSDGNQMAIRF